MQRQMKPMGCTFENQTINATAPAIAARLEIRTASLSHCSDVPDEVAETESDSGSEFCLAVIGDVIELLMRVFSF